MVLKKIFIGLGLVSVVYANSFIDLKNADVSNFEKNNFAIGTKFNVRTGEDFKSGTIVLSLSKKQDFKMSNLSKLDFEFFSSYFLSNMDSVNSPKLIYYSWEDKSNKKHSNVCMKKEVKLPKLENTSKCAIQAEIGTENVSEFKNKNGYTIICQKVLGENN